MSGFESVVEKAAIAWLAELGWRHVPGPVLAPDGEAPERDYCAVILECREPQVRGDTSSEPVPGDP